jgi:hypothetical protein
LPTKRKLLNNHEYEKKKTEIQVHQKNKKSMIENLRATRKGETS